jgi:hypothetical protein
VCDRDRNNKSWSPITDCPCDGTNDERGGGNWDHMQIVDEVDAAGNGDFLMLTHLGGGVPMLRAIPQFLMATAKYQYLGTGGGYECSSDGWLTTDPTIQHAFSAPLGAPLGPANSSKWCALAPPCCKKNISCSWACSKPSGATCVRSRTFSSGTRAWVNYTSGATCMTWADGVNTSTPGRNKEDGCFQAAAAATAAAAVSS